MQIITGSEPFEHIQGNNKHVQSRITDALWGDQPIPPYTSDQLSAIVEQFPKLAFLDKCWAADLKTRPSMEEVCEWLDLREEWEEWEEE